MRSSTAATGTYNLRTVTAALSIVVTSGATLGHTSAIPAYIYVYALDNAGTVELAVSSTRYSDNSILTTTTMSSSADDITGIYSTTGRSNVPVRIIGRLLSSQTTAGTWAAVATEISVGDRIDYP